MTTTQYILTALLIWFIVLARGDVVRSPRASSMVIPVQTGIHVTASAWWGYQSQTCAIQSTIDLRNWKTECAFAITNDPTCHTLIDYDHQPWKFYRALSQ